MADISQRFFSFFLNVNTWKTKILEFVWDYTLNGEGNGNPLQYSCLENPMDGGAW